MSLEQISFRKQRIDLLSQDIDSNTSQFVKTKPYPNDSIEIKECIEYKRQETSTFLKAVNYLTNLFKNWGNDKGYSKCIEPVNIEPVKIDVIQDTIPIIKKEQTYNYIDCDNAKFKKSCRPIIMPKIELPKEKSILNISNFDAPFGTISATTPLDETIVTGKLYQCCGVAIVDKKKNVQTLVHCYPGNSQEEFAKLFEHILAKSNPKDLSITVISGTYDDCDKTISAVVDTLKEQIPTCKIKFANFSKEAKIFDRAVVLENGKLSCCSNTEIENNINKDTNPQYKISHIDIKSNLSEKNS